MPSWLSGTAFRARHGGEAIILRNDDISGLHHIYERKIHAVISFGYSDRFRSGSLKNVRGIAQDYAIYFPLGSDFYVYIDDGASICVN